MNYANGKIYKLQCEDGYFYIGSTTTELRKRFKGHKDKYNEQENTDRMVYKHIRTIGWERVRIVLMEEFSCENKRQLTRKEDEFIRSHIDDPFCLNSFFAYRTEEQIQEYLENHKEYKKEWAEKNKPRLTEYKKQWYAENRDRILAKQKMR